MALKTSGNWSVWGNRRTAVLYKEEIRAIAYKFLEMLENGELEALPADPLVAHPPREGNASCI
jgi:hypothetical protein